jgi:RimJ/RimL family protein N-acetyltransferase
MKDLRAVAIESERLSLRSFTGADAAESFVAATVVVTRFMGWDPSPSPAAFAEVRHEWLPRMAAGTDVALTVRLRLTGEFLGLAGLHRIGNPEPELGIWIKEQAQGIGYGREAVAAMIAWAAGAFTVTSFEYPVVVENRRSRGVAESLGGVLAGTGILRKPSGVMLDEVVYRIPAMSAIAT